MIPQRKRLDFIKKNDDQMGLVSNLVSKVLVDEELKKLSQKELSLKKRRSKGFIILNIRSNVVNE